MRGRSSQRAISFTRFTVSWKDQNQDIHLEHIPSFVHLPPLSSSDVVQLDQLPILSANWLTAHSNGPQGFCCTIPMESNHLEFGCISHLLVPIMNSSRFVVQRHRFMFTSRCSSEANELHIAPAAVMESISITLMNAILRSTHIEFSIHEHDV